MSFIKTNLCVLAAVVLGVGVWTGCSDDDHDHDDASGHNANAPASCKAISDACHHVDTGEEGPIHTCHEQAHDTSATEQSCAAVKDNCVATCTAAAADAGEQHDGH